MEAIHAVAFANRVLLLRQIKRRTRLLGGHHAERRVEVLVEESRVLTRLEGLDRAVHNRAHRTSPVEPGGPHLIGGKKVRHFEIFFGRIRHQGKGIVGFAEEATSLSVWQIAAASTHQFG